MRSYEELIAPLVKAWRRLRRGKPAAYDGPEPFSGSAVCPPIAESLSPDGLSGRSADEEVISAAFRLGMDRGVDVFLEENRQFLEFLATALDGAEFGGSGDVVRNWLRRVSERHV